MTMKAGDGEACGAEPRARFCPACVPASEWHWFRWVAAAQPVLAAALVLLA